jgi:hypothetical protein
VSELGYARGEGACDFCGRSVSVTRTLYLIPLIRLDDTPTTICPECVPGLEDAARRYRDDLRKGFTHTVSRPDNNSGRGNDNDQGQRTATAGTLDPGRCA